MGDLILVSVPACQPSGATVGRPLRATPLLRLVRDVWRALVDIAMAFTLARVFRD
jgi:hypothetical protein